MNDVQTDKDYYESRLRLMTLVGADFVLWVKQYAEEHGISTDKLELALYDYLTVVRSYDYLYERAKA